MLAILPVMNRKHPWLKLDYSDQDSLNLIQREYLLCTVICLWFSRCIMLGNASSGFKHASFSQWRSRLSNKLNRLMDSRRW